ncbi:MAG: quinone-dependent dihydroorotate dehydrogenase [Calditrichia bacterium]
MNLYKLLIRPAFFRLSPESAHHLVMTFLKIPPIRLGLRAMARFESPRLRREVFGIQFPNPVGLAAGFDKDGEALSALGGLGFGFIEAGTVTPLAQPGNPKPRIFRFPKDEALINRMGFNNAGVEALRSRLINRRFPFRVAGNIGKNKITPNQAAISDYEKCFMRLHDVVDFFVVNVSSPNTPNLRELQDREPLHKLLRHLVALNRDIPQSRPILLKIAPDLSWPQIDDVIRIVSDSGIAGVVATNTTISREGLSAAPEKIARIGNGGMSGKPLRERSTEIIRYLSDRLGDDFPVVGVGGIHTPADAIEKLQAGAKLVEIYTGFIYEGPFIVKRIKKALAEYSG